MIATGPLLAGFLLASPCAGQDQDHGKDYRLTYQALPRHELVLPWDAWHPLGDELTLGEQTFVVSQEPQVLHLDTDGDGRLDSRVTSQKGRVQLHDRDSGFRTTIRVRRVEDHWDWAFGGVLEGRVAGTLVRLLDLDGDGRCVTYGVDGIATGGRGNVCLLSRIHSLDRALVHFEVTDERADGVATVSVRPYEGPVATLDARSQFASTGDLICALFRDGDVCMDVAEARQGALVPAGTYQLVAGRVARGARVARISAGRFQPIQLAPGAEVTVSWGGPLAADFSFDVVGDRLTVHPSVRFYGAAGAEFTDFAPIVRAPKLFVVDTESGDLVQYGRFGGCCGGGYSAWTATVPVGASLSVRLEHDRKLFGHIAGLGTQRGTKQR